MTDEAWQLFEALGAAGYRLAGHGLWDGLIEDSNLRGMTDVGQALSYYNPSTVVLQDKREWEGLTADRARDPRWRFCDVEALAQRPDVFKGTVLKDAQHDPAYNRQAAEEIGAHFWVTYYHPRIVKHLAPYVREQHLVRTHHTLDAALVPPFSQCRAKKVILSGAMSGAYPLRVRLQGGVLNGELPGTDVLPHPGYHRRGCATPDYLHQLTRYRVAICTSSRFGYAVRKIMEATACGCIVVTDLPTDEALPAIDGNLIRVPSEITARELLPILNALAAGWDAYTQQKWAEKAKTHYDYRAAGKRLADDIEALRRRYNEDQRPHDAQAGGHQVGPGG